jgi:hypothetical protein
MSAARTARKGIGVTVAATVVLAVRDGPGRHGAGRADRVVVQGPGAAGDPVLRRARPDPRGFSGV